MAPRYHSSRLCVDGSDPSTIDGGSFEYFVGTKDDVGELSKSGKTPLLERVEAPDFPGPEYAVALHGNLVVHRATPLRKPGELITMVNAYVSMDCMVDDQSRTRDFIGIDDPASLYIEWARHASRKPRDDSGVDQKNAIR